MTPHGVACFLWDKYGFIKIYFGPCLAVAYQLRYSPWNIHVSMRIKTMMLQITNVLGFTGPLWGIHGSSADSSYKKAVILSSDVLFDIGRNKLLDKQSGYWWCETPWRSCGVILMAMCRYWQMGNWIRSVFHAFSPRAKWLPFRRWYFGMHFPEW